MSEYISDYRPNNGLCFDSTQDEAILAGFGLRLIQLLNLPVKSNGRVDTEGGDKTALGLGRTVLRALQESAPGEVLHYQVVMGVDSGKIGVEIPKSEVPTKQTGGGIIPDEDATGLSMKLYDQRMKLTGQNGVTDYDEGFTNFLWTFCRSKTARVPRWHAAP